MGAKSECIKIKPDFTKTHDFHSKISKNRGFWHGSDESEVPLNRLQKRAGLHKLNFPQKTKVIGVYHGFRSLELPIEKTAPLYENTVKGKLKVYTKLLMGRHYYEKKYKDMESIISKCSYIVGVSEHSGYAAQVFFPAFPRDKIRVYYSPSKFINAVPGIDEVKKEKFILMLGGNRWVKNVYRGILALDELFSKKKMDGYNVRVAQQESRTISENILWGIQKRYKQGIVPNYEIYGYHLLEKAEGDAVRGVEIVEEEAEVVRWIFNQAAEGTPCTKIAQELNRKGTPAPKQRKMKKGKRGRANEDIEVGWTAERIRAMIKNERYCGDVTAQKTFVSDFLTHKSSRNKGEMPIYHLKDHHPAIISRELFESVQTHGTEITRNVEEIPFSGKLICPYCGRFYNVRNRRSNPIWFCPTSALNNGKRLCTAEKVYEQQVIYAVRKGVAERYRLYEYGREDDGSLDEVLEALTDSTHFTKQADGFLKDIRLQLLRLQDEDCNETERAYLKKSVAALQAELASAQNRVRVAESKIDATKIRAEIMGEPVGDLTRLEAVVANGKQKAETLSNELEAAQKELKDKESYWHELEENYEWRRQALAWIDTLPEDREGTQAFLNGLTDSYVKAFILDITIYSPLKYSIRWFDNTKTEVVMHSNVEDYRYSASYWDGSRMRENPKGKYGQGRLYG